MEHDASVYDPLSVPLEQARVSEMEEQVVGDWMVSEE
jgi:hypothetical protein